ncbi:hypothetical protein GCM10028895_44060 [Pontibacter rugosus]
MDGAGEETILARVGEGIVTSIGSSSSHKTVLENPDMISKLVLQKGLDAAQLTKFSLLILPQPSAAVTSAIWTTTACKTFSRTLTCAAPLLSLSRVALAAKASQGSNRKP